MDNDELDRILRNNGWQLEQDGQNRYLVIEGERVRYYDYPPAEYEIAVRKMIMQNTLAELAVLFDPNVLSGSAISDEEMRRKIEALYSHREQFQGREGWEEEFESTSQTLSALQFQFAGKRLLKYLDSLAKGKEDVEARKEGFRVLGSAPGVGEFGDMKVLGRHPGDIPNILQNLAKNMRDIADVDRPLDEIITQWYAKIAAIKKQIREVGNRAETQRSPAFSGFTDACCHLLDARRNEPEYDLALVDVNARMSRMRYAAPGIRHAAEAMFWLARVREPLPARVLSQGPSLFD